MIKLLLIDDDAGFAQVIASALPSSDFQILTAVSGADGLNSAQTQKPDLILLDQILPDVVGTEVLKTLKQQDETQTIPVVIITGYNNQVMEHEATLLGAAGYIMKYQLAPDSLATTFKDILQKQTSSKPQ